MTYTLGLIGGGNMAEAIVRGAISSGVLKPEAILVSEPVTPRRIEFESMGITAVTDNPRVVAECEQVMIAVKPQSLPRIEEALRGLDAEKQILISIMAGISSVRLESAVGKPARVLRVMPNTPLMVGQGMSVISRGAHAREGDEALAMRIFSAAGDAIMLEESAMDAVTAVSGSGPAYLFYLAQAMVEAGCAMGLEEAMAEKLARQTLLGAATLLKKEKYLTPASLRGRVTSPGGTTEAAIKHLDAQAVRATIAAAIEKAAERSRELGQ